jgi:UPF0716 protein FxsA
MRREMAVGRCDVLVMKPARAEFSPRSVALTLLTVLLATKVVTFVVAVQYVTLGVLLGVSVASAVLGLAVIGFAIWRYAAVVAAKLDRDEGLDDELASGMILLLAGVLLMLPGILCDSLGLLLLLPWTRRYLVTRLRRRLAAPAYTTPMAQARPGSRSASGEDGQGDGPAVISLPPRRRAA